MPIGVFMSKFTIMLAATLVWCLNTSNAAPVASPGYEIQLYATGMGAIAGIQVGPDGKVYAADNAGGRVFRAEPDGSVTQIASGIPYPNGITFTTAGRLFVASGGGQAVYEVANGAATVFANMGAGAYPTSVAALSNTLYVSNSGNGTISRVQMDGSIQVALSGYSNSGGPYGLSFDRAGKMYFLDHATGGVYGYDFKRPPKLLATATGWGGTFTGIGFKNRLFVTDVNTGYLLMAEDGGTTVVASGFAAKTSPPYIGPNGVAYDGRSKLYVADASSIYVITRVK